MLLWGCAEIPMREVFTLFARAQWWNRRTFLRALGMLGLATPTLLLWGCKPQNQSAQSSQPTKPTESKVHTVQMVSSEKASFFDPDRLHIQIGETVRWILQSGTHTTTSYHPAFFKKPLRIPEKATPWHSGVLKDAGQIFELKFDVEGVYNYYCTPHQSLGMEGIIVVGKPLDGPGLGPLPDMNMAGGPMTEGMLYPHEIEKLTELVAWAKKLDA